MNILFTLPNATKKTSGNWATANRLSKGLKTYGNNISINILEVGEVDRKDILWADVVHCFHLLKTFLLLQDYFNNTKLQRRWIVSFTGTDLELLKTTDNQSDIISLLEKTQGVVVFHEKAREELISLNIRGSLIKVIPQSPNNFPKQELMDMRSVWGVKKDEILFLLAGGIRSVKNPLRAVKLLKAIADKRAIKLIMIGPILEEEAWISLRQELQSLPWISYQGEIEHSLMAAAYQAADVVLNTSDSEGMPNTLLEAMQFQKPLLGYNNKGNAAIIKHEINGFLYNNQEEFTRYALQLIDNRGLASEMGARGKELLLNSTLEREAGMYIELYTKI